MVNEYDAENLNRTAKYFMDNGRADSPEAAMELLEGFGMTILVGKEATTSAEHQTALLTLVNAAARSFLGGVEVAGVPNVVCVTPLAAGENLQELVVRLGGKLVTRIRDGWPAALIGEPSMELPKAPAWFLSWKGWAGGVIPARDAKSLPTTSGIPVSPVLAAAVCASEVFSHHAGDHPLAGRRSPGLSLWAPAKHWQAPEENAPALGQLPAALWLIGLGNLGQAYAWTLACLPYASPRAVEVYLQDVDVISAANVSTSVLSFAENVGKMKTRVVSDWLGKRGFTCRIVERRFNRQTQRAEGEPGLALFGVDNALARAELDCAGFGLVVESGLGAGPQGFRSIVLHSFPATRSADAIWRNQIGLSVAPDTAKPAYELLKLQGMITCGLTKLATRTVAVPFTGLTAACLVVGELLRRLHGGAGTEVASVSMTSLTDVEAVMGQAPVYSFGHTNAKPTSEKRGE
jgi:hypothetical protein